MEAEDEPEKLSDLPTYDALQRALEQAESRIKGYEIGMRLQKGFYNLAIDAVDAACKFLEAETPDDIAETRMVLADAVDVYKRTIIS